MALQTVVKRNFATGFAGKIAADGPTRCRVARIQVAAPTTADPAIATINAISRVFGYKGEGPTTDGTIAADAPLAVLGGGSYLGVLGAPDSYQLVGDGTNPLNPTYQLPGGELGEFFTMAIMSAEIFNETTTAKNLDNGFSLAYCVETTAAVDNAQAVPLGGLIAYPGASVPKGFRAIPGRVRVAATLPASAAGAAKSVVTQITLTA